MDTRSAAALARNDRYVREFVEGFNFCPYAKRCHETGKLHRVVLLGETDLAQAVDAAILRFEQMPPDAIEVGLIIIPAFDQGARAFEMLAGAARERMQARHARGDTPFYCVAFHPALTEDLSDEHRAVRFLRRSPDPTLQLVRAGVLRKVRGSDPHGEDVSVSDRIARANLDTLRREGVDKLRALLSRMKK